jgi:hypothetical protein
VKGMLLLRRCQVISVRQARLLPSGFAFADRAEAGD